MPAARIPAVDPAQEVERSLRKLPPQNIEAEESVLGAVLLENEAIDAALELITADDFYREAHRKIMRSMVDLLSLIHI